MKNWNKIICLILVAVMSFSIVACKPNDDTANNNGGNNGGTQGGSQGGAPRRY